jgi:thiol-disulfide isomerase/thioredoxin
VGFIVVVVIVTLASSNSGPFVRPPAPPLPHEHLSGPAASLAALRGHPALVVFWASWCPPCHTEAPAIERYATTVPGHAPVIGVDFDDAADSARSFVREYHWTFPVVRDANGKTKGPWDLVGMPTTVVLDSRLRIVRRLTGAQTVASLSAAIGRVSAS